MAKLKKTQSELSQYIWNKYPNDNQLEIRLAMFESYEFLTGNIDIKEKRLKEQSKYLYNKLMKNDTQT